MGGSMREGEAFSTARSASVEEGNELFRAAVRCLELDHDLAAQLLRDHLRRYGYSVRTVMPRELGAIVEDLEPALYDLLEDPQAHASIGALRRLVGTC
jgi:hypothetical protein